MQDRITLVLVRHPETEGNVLTNSEMTGLERPNHLFRPTEKGLWQVKQALQAFIDLGFARPTAIYCSTALQTRVVADAFHEHFRSPIIEDSRLNEKWDGIFHSLSQEDIETRYPDQIEQRKKYGWYHFIPFGGENGPAVEMRIRSFFADIGSNDILNGKTIVIGAHGNWLHLFEGIVKKWPWQKVEEERRKNPFPNCSVSVYHFCPLNSFTNCLDRHAPWNSTDPVQYA